jgi:hypothetical protein
LKRLLYLDEETAGITAHLHDLEYFGQYSNLKSKRNVTDRSTTATRARTNPVQPSTREATLEEKPRILNTTMQTQAQTDRLNIHSYCRHTDEPMQRGKGEVDEPICVSAHLSQGIKTDQTKPK